MALMTSVQEVAYYTLKYNSCCGTSNSVVRVVFRRGFWHERSRSLLIMTFGAFAKSG